MKESLINYQELVKGALKGVFRDILLLVEKNGLQGEQHYYITFKTDEDGVKIPKRLKTQYPATMTIVIQHRFWDFKVEENHFEIGLSFNQKPELLVIPYDAVTSLVDPSERFALQFDESALGEEKQAEDKIPIEEAPPKEKDQKNEDSDKVVSIDAFRKN